MSAQGNNLTEAISMTHLKIEKNLNDDDNKHFKAVHRKKLSARE